MKYDVVIIGGGITGTGIAHELAKYQLKTILLESGTDVAFCNKTKWWSNPSRL